MTMTHTAIRVSPFLQLSVSAATLASFAVCRILFNSVGLRTFGHEAVGRINTAFSWSLLLTLIVSAGLVPALSRYLPLSSGTSSADKLTVSVLIVGMASALALSSGLLIAALVDPTLVSPSVAIWAAIWAVLFSSYTIVRAHWFAHSAPLQAGRYEFVSVMSFGLALLLASKQPSLDWLPLTAYLLPASFPGFFLLFRATTLPTLPSGFLHFGWIALLGSLATMGIAFVATLVVSAVSGYSEAARWATLVSATSPLLLLPRTLAVFFLPRLSSLHRSAGSVFETTSNLHQALASAGAAGVAGSALPLAPFVLSALLGSTPTTTDFIVWKLLLLGLFALVRVEPLITALASMGDQRASTAAAWAGALGCLLIWLLFAGRYGAVAVAAGYALTGTFCLVLLATFLRLRLSIVRLRVSYSDVLFCLVFALSWFRHNRWDTPLLSAASVLLLVAAFQGSRALRHLRASSHAFRVPPAMASDAPY
jgi:O-antigen/teichoic acid export membrane protein